MGQQQMGWLRLGLAQVVGDAGETTWSQVVVWPAGTHTTERGMVVLAVTFEGDEAAERGKTLVSTIETQVATLLDGGVSLVGVLASLGKKEPSLVSLMAVKVVGTGMEMVACGRARAVLMREERRGTVLEGRAGEWLRGAGQLRVGDRWLLGTEGLLGEMSDTLMDEVLGFSTVLEAGEELNTQVYAADETSSVAGVLMYVGEAGGEIPRMTAKPGDETLGEAVASEPKVFLKEPNKRRKTALSVGLVILAMLSVSMWFGWRARAEKQMEQAFVQATSEATTTMGRAEALTDVLEGREQAKKAVFEAEEALAPFLKQEKYKGRTETFLTELKTRAEKAGGESAISSVPVWYDLTLMREGMVGTVMAKYDNMLYVLDGERGLVVGVDAGSKQASVVAGGDLIAGASLLTAGPGKRLIAYSGAGLIDVDTTRQTTAVLVKPGEQWERVVGVGVFAGNAYLLDGGASEIWRYPGLSSGVGAAQRWLAPGVTPDLGGVIDMVIDGDVWMATDQGKVLQYRRGNKENFRLDEGVGELSSLKAIDTSEESEYVYLLDQAGLRVVAVTKEGAFVKQYVWEGISGVSDLAVVEEESKAFLLSGSSIYSLSL